MVVRRRSRHSASASSSLSCFALCVTGTRAGMNTVSRHQYFLHGQAYGLGQRHGRSTTTLTTGTTALKECYNSSWTPYFSAVQLHRPRHPRQQHSCAFGTMTTQMNSTSGNGVSSSSSSSVSGNNVGDSELSYLVCVECAAVYLVEPEEVYGEARIVRCSACHHEWYASESELLWGESSALSAAATIATPGAARTRAALSNSVSDEVSSRESRRERKLEIERERELERERERRKGESYHIFVANLSFRATEDDLYAAFGGYGIVKRCHIAVDSFGGSKGYGFVEMSDKNCALQAIDALQGMNVLGRDIFLSEARPRQREQQQQQQQQPQWRDHYEQRTWSSGGSGGSSANRTIGREYLGNRRYRNGIQRDRERERERERRDARAWKQTQDQTQSRYVTRKDARSGNDTAPRGA